jgi:tetratricopeptide (TPR) repeat protein
MIACASPSHKNAEESLNCLRYANRAKNIQNLAVVNVDPHSKLVNVLRGQVEALAGELLRLSNRSGGKVDSDRFSLELLKTLVKGGKEAQGVIIGEKAKAESATLDATTAEFSNNSVKELTTELERSRLSLKGDLADKPKQLDALVSERNSLRRTSESTSGSPSRTLFSAVTPSKAKGSTRDESIQEILTTLSDAGNGVSENDIASPALATVESGEELSTTLEEPCATSEKELQSAKYQITKLSSEVQSLRESLDHSKQQLDAKTEELQSILGELETVVEESATLRERLENTPDIDEETIHYIVKQITSYDDQRMENFQSEDDDDAESISSSTSSAEEEDERKRERNEEMSNFASAMFSTGKFLVDREMYQDSISCFETVLEVRRELYGWDDPLVGDALHMEGFVRSKMGDYDRALMLLWDALRIRKVSSEPLKISATLRLLADLHFSKEENMHAALFYEECARHLKEHDMKDPHLPLVLIDLARTKDRLGEYGESMNFFEESLMLYERALDHDDDRIASLQYEMGVLAFQMGDRERGESCFRHFIRIRKSKGREMDEGVANALFVLGSLHWATKKRDLAHDCWVEALEIFKGLGRNDDDPYVKSLKEKISRAQRRPIGRLFRG